MVAATVRSCVREQPVQVADRDVLGGSDRVRREFWVAEMFADVGDHLREQPLLAGQHLQVGVEDVREDHIEHVEGQVAQPRQVARPVVPSLVWRVRRPGRPGTG